MNFVDTISFISSIFGIISFGPIIYAVVVYVFYKRGEKKRRIKVIHDNMGFTNAALIVSLGINSIVVDVKTYIQNNPELKDVIKEENVFEVPFKKDIAHDDKSQSEIDSILNDVREKGRQMKEQGVQRVHLFFAGPAAIAAMVGAELSNQHVVFCYQRPTREPSIKTNYVCWGPMQRKKDII